MSNNHPPTDGSWRHQLGSPEFPAEPDRYHLYVGLFCPFAHRAIITRELKGLQRFLSMDVVKAYPKDDGGWRFPATNDEYPGATVDSLFGSKFLHEIYFKSDKAYKGKYSVPVLWDKKTNQIVNNESEDIMRMLNTAFNDLLAKDDPKRQLNYYPPELKDEIDQINSWMMPNLNAGVYKAGFASNQEDYEKNAKIVFDTLNRLEAMVKESNTLFLLGNTHPTEIDIKLYTTLVRFDTIYQQHFKLMLRSIRHGYPHLNRWLKHFYWKVDGVKETTNFKHIKENYSKSHGDINPKAITPLGPEPEVEHWTDEDERWRKSVLG
ncbi:glutathionyl-hydroquinone reductase, partial [Lecanoromycetidae sp. Uapishka_2]